MNDSLTSQSDNNTVDSGKKNSPTDWARFWFSKLARFHRVHDPAKWIFAEQDVIGFLRSKLKTGMPAWKRLMIEKGLILYRNKFLRSPEPRLEHIRAKLQELAVRERTPHDDVGIEETSGKINPNEPKVIQEMRRTLRCMA